MARTRAMYMRCTDRYRPGAGAGAGAGTGIGVCTASAAYAGALRARGRTVAWYGRLGTGTLPKTWVHLWTHVPSGKCGMSTYSKTVFLCGTTQRTVIINYTVLYSTEQSVWYLGFPKAKERVCV